MSFTDDDLVMRGYLLDLLTTDERARIDARLVEDPDFFDRLEAFEDDLIVRWHRRLLNEHDHVLFVRAYEAPHRQRRIDRTLELIRAVAPPPHAAPRVRSFSHWVIAASLLIAVGGLALLPRIWSPQPKAVSMTVALIAVGDRSVSVGYDLVRLTPNVTTVQLKVDVPDLAGAVLPLAEISAIDRKLVRQYTGSDLHWVSGAGELTVTVPATDLAVGDYILTVRGSAQGPQVVVRRPFRVLQVRD